MPKGFLEFSVVKKLPPRTFLFQVEDGELHYVYFCGCSCCKKHWSLSVELSVESFFSIWEPCVLKSFWSLRNNLLSGQQARRSIVPELAVRPMNSLLFLAVFFQKSRIRGEDALSRFLGHRHFRQCSLLQIGGGGSEGVVEIRSITAKMDIFTDLQSWVHAVWRHRHFICSRCAWGIVFSMAKKLCSFSHFFHALWASDWASIRAILLNLNVLYLFD